MVIYKTDKGTYEKGELIGSGAFSKVYIVTKSENNHKYALAEIKETAIQGLDRQFELGYTALEDVYHKNLVSVKDRGMSDKGQPFAIMEYLQDKIPISQFIIDKNWPLDPKTILLIGIQLCQALGAMHSKSIIHGDLQPSNILLGQDLSVKIIDYGLARPVSFAKIPNQASRLKYLYNITYGNPIKTLGSHQVAGALGFTAPEAITNPISVDSRSDIYSLGCVLYFLLTGRTPIGVYKKPSELRSDIPEFWDIVLEKCIAYDPQERYSAVDQVERSLNILSVTDLNVHRPAMLHRQKENYQRIMSQYDISPEGQPSTIEHSLAIAIIAFNVGWLLFGSLSIGFICFIAFGLLTNLCLRWLYQLARCFN